MTFRYHIDSYHFTTHQWCTTQECQAIGSWARFPSTTEQQLVPHESQVWAKITHSHNFHVSQWFASLCFYGIHVVKEMWPKKLWGYKNNVAALPNCAVTTMQTCKGTSSHSACKKSARVLTRNWQSQDGYQPLAITWEQERTLLLVISRSNLCVSQSEWAKVLSF